MATEEIVSSRFLPNVPKVSVVGIGGAGNNFLTKAIGRGLSPDSCVAVNTDRNQLSHSPAINKVLLDGESLEARDFSLQNEASRKMLQLSAHRVRPFTDASDITILVAGLGGETATGTAPLIAQWTRTSIRPVISIVAIPFIHERERRFLALRGLKHMVDACDCTIVLDNAIENDRPLAKKRQADEKASLAVRSLEELISRIEPEHLPEVLRIMSLGQIAVTCSARVRPNGTIQSAVIEALHNPSANLPLVRAQGAILLHQGPNPMRDGEAAQAYEALSSLVGRNVQFVHASLESSSDSTVSLLLTGYDYGTAVKAFVDLIEDLYDVEYGQSSLGPISQLQVGLYQMELDGP